MPLSVWSVSWSVMTNQIMLEISRSSIDLPSSSSSRPMAVRHSVSSRGVSWMPIHPARSYFAMRLAERLGSRSPLKKIGGCGFCSGLWPKPDGSKSANSPWYSKVSFVQMPLQISIVSRTCVCRLREDVRGARGSELLGHPPGTDTDVEPAAGEVVDGGALRGEDAGRAVRGVGDAHADPHLGRLRRQPRDQRPALEPLAAWRRPAAASGTPPSCRTSSAVLHGRTLPGRRSGRASRRSRSRDPRRGR